LEQSKNQSSGLSHKKLSVQKESIPGLEFIEGNLPKGYSEGYEIALFNQEVHRQGQSPERWVCFHAMREDKKNVLASIFFLLESNTAFSPRAAPFGSFELADEITTSQLFEFIGFCETRLRKHGIQKVEIKGYPEQYDLRHHNVLSVLLFNHGYSITLAELGACIAVDETSFGNKINKWERRKLKQAHKAGLTFNLCSLKEVKSIYDFINQCRKEKGHALSMSYDDLAKTVKSLDRNFYCFAVYHQATLVAASISIKVKKKILYNFYSAHSRTSDELSPVVFLMEGIYTWCQAHRFEVLDLGTSALGGKPNFSLLDFKLRLGANPTMKLTFEKILE